MLQQVIDIFGVHAEYRLDIMRPEQTPATITCDVLGRFDRVLAESGPDAVLVHGDTSTAFAAALAAFYRKIPVGHVEAGLRTYDMHSPFPEEMNRVLISRLAELHFVPTEENRACLARENIRDNVFVTGNTVIDAFRTTLRPNYVFRDPTLAALSFEGRRTILLTAHRRENLGGPLENIFEAVRRLHDAFPDVQFVYPVHLNPRVRQPAYRMLGGLPRVMLLPPLDVEDLHNLLARITLVLTDSGGLQEEAPFFGVPVLVLRTQTERMEAVQAGTAEIVGVETDAIVWAARRLLTDPAAYARMACAKNPYGDGHASERIVAHLLAWQAQRGKPLAVLV